MPFTHATQAVPSSSDAVTVKTLLRTRAASVVRATRARSWRRLTPRTFAFSAEFCSCVASRFFSTERSWP